MYCVVRNSIGLWVVQYRSLQEMYDTYRAPYAAFRLEIVAKAFANQCNEDGKTETEGYL